MTSTIYRPLTNDEIDTLTDQGCSCADWSAVQAAEGFKALRVRHTHFAGAVRLGANGGGFTDAAGTEKIAGIFNAYLHNVTVGNDVRIANVGVHIANADIGDNARIENVGTIETRPDAAFGNGVEIEPINEGGGRELILFNRLDSQFAHLLCVHRYRTGFIEKLQAMAHAEAGQAKSNRGTIGRNVVVCNVKQIVDVCIGDHATIDSAASLVNGTVLSSEQAPTLIGADVQAEDFIVAEGSHITGGAVVTKSYVGQGCRIGRQFSSEGSAFFANCEGFHGEACSIFAGPYTVTHHKSTLLIAGMFSFYNAGSGTNQSNHLYKLGPIHEGKLERGCKTGSFSYMMWPCRVGPFSVVLGKHTRTFDTSDLPFSYVEASPTGHCLLTPGFNLTTVGTVRDGAKWPARDRRKGTKRDRLTFDVFSPLTVGRMLRGSARMKQLQETTDKAIDTVTIEGAEVKRVMLRKAQKTYRLAIEMYLMEKVLARAESGQSLEAGPDAVFCAQWIDIGGQMMPRQRLDDLCHAVESASVADLDAFHAALDNILAAYAEDEWAWVRWAFEQTEGAPVEQADLAQVADRFAAARSQFLKLVLNDAAKEFDSVIQTGMGHDGTPDDVAADALAVRGEYETNKFVVQVTEEIDAVARRVETFKQTL